MTALSSDFVRKTPLLTPPGMLVTLRSRNPHVRIILIPAFTAWSMAFSTSSKFFQTGLSPTGSGRDAKNCAHIQELEPVRVGPGKEERL